MSVTKVSVALFVGLALLVSACAPSSTPAAPTAAAKAPAPVGAAQAAPTAVAKQAAPAAKPAAKKVLRVGSNQDLNNVNPALISGSRDRLMMNLVYSGLVRYKGATSEVIPGVAEKWELSPDGKTYTFHLRKGVQFQKNYGELTSADVKFTVAYHQNPATKSRVKDLFDGIERVEAPDPYTVVFHMKAPVNGFLPQMAWQAGYILSEKATTTLGAKLGTEPVGTGPFELTKWTKGQEILFTRFDKYFGPKPDMDEVQVKVIPDTSTQMLAIQNGEIDVAPVGDLAALVVAKQSKGVNVQLQPINQVNFAFTNMRAGRPLASKQVRQALMYAVDFKGMGEATQGILKPLVSPLHPLAFGHTSDVPTYPYDPNRAKALLAEGGYKGEPIQIVFMKLGMLEEIAQVLKDSWSKVGVNAELVKMDNAGYRAAAPEAKFDVYLRAIARDTPDELLSPYFTSKGANAYSGYSNLDVDKMIDDASSETNEAASKSLYARLQKQLMDDLPILPTSHQQGAWATGSKVQSFVFDVSGMLMQIGDVRLAN